MKKPSKKKSKKKRHLGFNIVLDIINPQLKKRFKASEAKNVTEIEAKKKYLFTATVKKREFIFRIEKNIVSVVGPLPDSTEWLNFVTLEKRGHLCPEALLCAVQNIEFDPSARIL